MDHKFRSFIRRESAGWQLWEIIYVLFCTSAIGVISFIMGSSIIGIASALTGTLYTMLAGKGKISCYCFGIFNSASYGYISFSQKLYGDAMLNWFWYLPMMFAGIIFWRKKMDDQSCVIKNRLNSRQRIFTVSACVCGIAAYAAVLRHLGDAQPVTDSITTVLSVAAMILTVRRCVEQWLMWIIVNAVSVMMWYRVYLNGDENIATLLWWIIMLITGVIFFIQWSKGAKSEGNA